MVPEQKMQKPDRNAPEAQSPQADRAVNVTISREGLESLQTAARREPMRAW